MLFKFGGPLVAGASCPWVMRADSADVGCLLLSQTLANEFSLGPISWNGFILQTRRQEHEQYIIVHAELDYTPSWY